MKVGVAISTIPERKTMGLENAERWKSVLPEGSTLVMNIDETHKGVAQNKNAGLAALMMYECDHLFLADDDMHPLYPQSWRRYVEHEDNHLMLCWGPSRFLRQHGTRSYWSWPRGVLLYLTKDVVEKAGGMRTDFRNGHEHVEYSQRIARIYGRERPFVDLAHTPEEWFHAEDMRRPRESAYKFMQRKRALSTVHRSDSDVRWNNALLEKYKDSTDYVEYR